MQKRSESTQETQNEQFKTYLSNKNSKNRTGQLGGEEANYSNITATNNNTELGVINEERKHSSAGQPGKTTADGSPNSTQGFQGAMKDTLPKSRDRAQRKSRSLAQRPKSELEGQMGKNNRGESEQPQHKDDSKKANTSVRPKEDDSKPKASSQLGGASAAKQAKGNVHNVVTKFSFATKAGIAAHNPYKVNQDAYLTNPHMLNLRHSHFFSVCDGHGHNGQEVSGLLKHRLPFHIEKNVKEGLV